MHSFFSIGQSEIVHIKIDMPAADNGIHLLGVAAHVRHCLFAMGPGVLDARTYGLLDLGLHLPVEGPGYGNPSQRDREPGGLFPPLSQID